MNNLNPIAPSYTISYWKPWKEDSNALDSWTNYIKDVSLAKYTADTIGEYIQSANDEQIKEFNKIQNGLNDISFDLLDVKYELNKLNRNAELQKEQQIISNLLLNDISEILKVPDSEKQRLHSIELGLKFFANSSKDTDLYKDSLEELQRAESLLKQDYFVLYRIGLIYLHAPNLINIEKSVDYFLRSAKYASIDSDINKTRLSKYIKNESVDKNLQNNNNKNVFASQSFEKASFCYYLLNNIEKAIYYQKKAVEHYETPNNYFLLAKYQSRLNQNNDSIENLYKSIKESPNLWYSANMDIDFISNKDVINSLEILENEANNSIIDITKNEDRIILDKSITELKFINNYPLKIKELKKIKNQLLQYEDNVIIQKQNRNDYNLILKENQKLINDIKKLNEDINVKNNKISSNNKEIELFKSKEKLNSKSAFFWSGGSIFVIYFIVMNILDPNHATDGLTIFLDLFLSIIAGFAGMGIRNINNIGYFKLEIKELENNNISINKDLKELIESIDKIEKKVDYNIKKINTLKNKTIIL